MNKGLICLSVFDGISCGQVALEKAGIHVDKYYASEIDKYAISVTQRYRCLGNGWTVEVIVHILRCIYEQRT